MHNLPFFSSISGTLTHVVVVWSVDNFSRCSFTIDDAAAAQRMRNENTALLF